MDGCSSCISERSEAKTDRVEDRGSCSNLAASRTFREDMYSQATEDLLKWPNRPKIQGQVSRMPAII